MTTPTPEALATAAVTAAADLAKHPELGDGTLDLHAALIAAVDQATADLATARAALAAAAADAMDGDSAPIAGLGVLTREVSRSVSWDTKAARAAIKAAIVDSVVDDFGSDSVAGIIADRAVNETYAAVGGSPKVTGMTKLGLDADDYRATSLTGWRVKLMRVESLDTTKDADRW